MRQKLVASSNLKKPKKREIFILWVGRLIDL